MSTPIVIEGSPDGISYAGDIDFVNATVTANSFKIANGASSGYILTSDVDGNATWAINTPTTGGGWVDLGTVLHPVTVTDSVILGSTLLSGTERLRVLDGAVLFDGTTGSTPVSGAGTRFMWSGAKAALRAGSVAGTEWDDSNIGANSVAFGDSTSATAANSTALGRESLASRFGEVAFSGANIAANGDAQCSFVAFSLQTTDATPTELFLDGSAASERFIIPDDTTAIFEVSLAATDNTDNLVLTQRIALRRGTGVGTTTLLANDSIKLVGNPLTWSLIPTADTTNGSLLLTATGEAATTINWSVSARVTSVTM
jgi:hypothetical protein